MAETSYTKGEERPPNADLRSPEGDDPNKPDVAGQTDPYDVDTSLLGKGSCGCGARRERLAFPGSRDCPDLPGRYPDHPPQDGKKRQPRQHPHSGQLYLQHPLRQYRSDAAGGLQQSRRIRSSDHVSSKRARCLHRRSPPPIIPGGFGLPPPGMPGPPGMPAGAGPPGAPPPPMGPQGPGAAPVPPGGPMLPPQVHHRPAEYPPNAPSAGCRSPATNDA